MSTMEFEDLYTDAEDYGDSDLYDESEEGDQDDLEGEESYDDSEDEESRAWRRRRRARRIALARRRQALARARARARRRTLERREPAARSTAAAIRTVDLESKVADDSIRRELAAQRSRSTRSEYATVASLAVNQFVESFNQPANVFAKAALRASPLLLLSPQSRGRGVQSVIADPRVIGGVALLGLTFLGQQRDKATIEVAGPSVLAVGDTVRFAAQVLSTAGAVIPGRVVSWETSDVAVATVTPAGDVTATGRGAVFIIAKSDGLPDKRVSLTVT